MKNKPIIITILIFLLTPFVIAEDFTLDENQNRFVIYEFLKGDSANFIFESNSYVIKMGNLDFDNERVTIQLLPELGTRILNKNTPLEEDLDKDDKKDISITMTNYYPDKGLSEDGTKGIVRIRLEALTEPIVESVTTTTIEETTTTTIEENVSTTGQEITGRQVEELSNIGNYGNPIIIGAIILILLLIIINRKRIAKIFQGKDILKKKIEEEPKEHAPCPTCGRDTVVGDKFCIGCGANLPARPKFCTKCGEKIRVDSKFCASCGNKVSK